MKGGSQTPAYVRTGTPISAGVIVTLILNYFGVELGDAMTSVVTGLSAGAYYVLGRALETWNPKLGYVLGIAKQPAYSTEPAPSPGTGEEVVADVVPETPGF
jgi:hypothetical protein